MVNQTACPLMYLMDANTAIKLKYVLMGGKYDVNPRY